MRLKVAVRGAVQGVGFRPFVHRLATEMALRGWVNNSAQGACLEVEGPPRDLEQFLLRLESEKPPRCFFQSLEASWLDPAGYEGFAIRPSDPGGAKTALVLPDVATCPDCLRELFDPNDRRYGYPFINCTNCGPRFSIIESLPYDRPNTTMRLFPMCPRCQAEYEDPANRRFHAQPNACPNCGPHLELWGPDGKPPAPPANSPAQRSREALAGAVAALREGKILAVKGIGGCHLIVAAHDDAAVRRLRERKHREEKPFALMFPSLESVRSACEVSPLEERLLRSPEAPIVLLRRHPGPGPLRLSPALAPGNPNLGVMLPYAPLHHLLLGALGAPVVATSGNLSDEPICIDEHEALQRLGGLADLFLVHNRPIARHVDDSIVRVMLGRELVLRRARGYAPLPVQLRSAKTAASSGAGVPPANPALPLQRQDAKTGSPSAEEPKCVLAVGAHLKNTVALSSGSQVFISQHIGDLETDQAFGAFQRVIADFERLYAVQPNLVAADAHPDYLSTKFAQALAKQNAPRYFTVQHHLAHVLACLAENELEPPALGVSWDGTGYGLDGSVWGGEFFLVGQTSCRRLAHLRQFRLPGGEQAVKEPRRAALGVLYEMFGDAAFAMENLAPLRAFSAVELAALKIMLARKLNSPLTSSAGRLFDAVAALLGLRQQVRFEGQAAMELEFAAGSVSVPNTSGAIESRPSDARPARENSLPLPGGEGRREGGRTSVGLNSERIPPEPPPLVLDWSPAIDSVLADLRRGVPISQISADFHNALARLVVSVARHAGQERVLLSGGCFQNRLLTERTVQRLRDEGFRPYWHQRVPPNDGGIALGQAVAALRGLGL
jgi:hydrogenase maturation protein HypF